MTIELTPRQQAIIERAVETGMTVEDSVDRAFDLLELQLGSPDFQPDEWDAIEAHIEEGLAQADRGELINAEEAIRRLHEHRTKRNVA